MRTHGVRCAHWRYGDFDTKRSNPSEYRREQTNEECVEWKPKYLNIKHGDVEFITHSCPVKLNANETNSVGGCLCVFVIPTDNGWSTLIWWWKTCALPPPRFRPTNRPTAYAWSPHTTPVHYHQFSRDGVAARSTFHSFVKNNHPPFTSFTPFSLIYFNALLNNNILSWIPYFHL